MLPGFSLNSKAYSAVHYAIPKRLHWGGVLLPMKICMNMFIQQRPEVIITIIFMNIFTSRAALTL
jgi:hypothetical protein